MKKRLEKYREKRDEKRTPEPFTETVTETVAKKEGLLFVIHAHNARRMHYDLRLEHDGVLVSWAVPKGLPPTTKEKHMAVHVEDHPLPYGDFEGFIPKGQYGGGDVIIWDKGTYVPLGDFDQGMKDGKLVVEFFGQKARGLYTLVKTKRDWLVMKKDEGWRPKDKPGSDVRPGAAIASELEQRGVSKRPLVAKDVVLMLAETAEGAFSDPDFLFELKYDGYRLLASKDGGAAKLRYRGGNEVADRFPEIAAAVKALDPKDVILDGELVALDEKGVPRFGLLQQRVMITNPHDVQRAAKSQPLVYMAFDLLALEGFDLRSLPLVERKAYLKRLLVHAPERLRFADHVLEDGEALLERVKAIGLEGVMAKRAAGKYKSGRSGDWLKLRFLRTADLVVIGYNEPESRGRVGFSGLFLAAREGNGWRYCGRVGSGFDGQKLQEIRATLDTMVMKRSICEVPKDEHKGAVWVAPRMVIEVRYTEVSHEGNLRQPVFLRLRHDKPPEECVLSAAKVVLQHEATAKSTTLPATSGIPTSGFTVSNPKKEFFPGITKQDLVDYYRNVAPYALPYYADRPAILTRYPDGYSGKSFFQKDAPDYAPPWLRRERMFADSSQRDIDHFILDSADALAYVANLGTIPIHVWSSRIQTLEKPDYTVIDLDPKSAPFTDVITIALAVKKLCDAIGLEAFAKTTGSSGMHILIPLGGACTYAQSKTLAVFLGGRIAEELADIATTERDTNKRKGKVYVDCYQNGHGKTIAASYCVRPHPEAPVSMPLEWAQVTKKLTPRAYTVKNALKHLEKRARDPHEGLLTATPDLVGALEKLVMLTKAR